MTQNMVLDVSLFNTQHYKGRIKSKRSNPVKGVAPYPTLHLSVVAIEKGAFELPSTSVGQLNYIYIYKQDLALNNPQGLICHNTQPN